MFKIFKIQLLVGLVFSVLIFIAFSSDMNNAVLTTFVHVPFVFVLCFYNGVVLAVMNKINSRFWIINYSFPAFPLLVWFLLSHQVITIRYWNIESAEFIIAIITLILTNLAGYYIFNPQTGELANSQQ